MSNTKPNPWVRPFLLSLPVLAVLGSGVAHAASDHDVRTLDVEIVDAAKGTSETTRMTVALDGHKPSRISIPIGDFQYFVDARCDAPQSGHVPTTVTVKRSDHRPGAPGRIDVDAAAGLSPGIRTVLATVSRPDGSRIEIAVRVH